VNATGWEERAGGKFRTVRTDYEVRGEDNRNALETEFLLGREPIFYRTKMHLS